MQTSTILERLPHDEPHKRSFEELQEYTPPLFLVFVDLRKALVSVETEADIEALLIQGVHSQHIRVLLDVYTGFTTKTSSIYNAIALWFGGHHISEALQRHTEIGHTYRLKWTDMGVKIGGRQMNHIHLADDSVLVALSNGQEAKYIKP